MLTTLSITSLDQGKALGRWNVDRLYAEPIDPVPTDVAAQTMASDVVAIEASAPKSTGQSWLARIRAFLATGYPFATRRTQPALTKP